MPADRIVIPHSRPTVGEEDAAAVAAAVRSGNLAQGAQVRRFEDAVAGLLGRRGGVAVSSGTSALHLALLALGVGPGDEVLMPSYACVALLQAVRYVGGAPRLVEVDPGTYNLCPDDFRGRVTRAVRAVIVPHMFGLAADLAEIAAAGVPVIEDCAQAIGAEYRGRPAGSAGVMTVCSFYATKVLTTGEGGMLLADSPAILGRVRDLRDYDGRWTLATRFNYKMTEMQAALGLSQLRRLPMFLATRRALAARYARALRGLPVDLPAVPRDRTHIFYRYVVRAAGAARLAAELARRGVESRPPVFRPLHRYTGGVFPRTDDVARTALSLPIYPSLADAEQDRVVAALGAALAHRDAVGQEERLWQASSSRS